MRKSLLIYDLDGQKDAATPTFFRGENARFHPSDSSLDHPEFVSNHLAHGMMPSRPLIERDTKIVAFGSCFAANISRQLKARGFNVTTQNNNVAYVSKMGDGIVTTHAIRQQFEWAWEDKAPRASVWHSPDATELGLDESVRRATRDLFDQAEIFILTYGLSEVWYDQPTGEVFWRAVPFKTFDPARHKFRVSSHSENLTNLRAIHGLIRKNRPQAVIVQTLSPIALTATFRGMPCIAANAASKAILRSALDEFHRDVSDENTFYFPSYEIALHAFDHALMEDRKHVHDFALDFIMKVFERYYCHTDLNDRDLREAFKHARELEKKVRRDGHWSVPRSQLVNIRRKIERRSGSSDSSV